jgi:hypothetical protein
MNQNIFLKSLKMTSPQNRQFFLYKGSAGPNSITLSPLPKNGNFYYNYSNKQVFIYFGEAGWISLSAPQIGETEYPIKITNVFATITSSPPDRLINLKFEISYPGSTYTLGSIHYDIEIFNVSGYFTLVASQSNIPQLPYTVSTPMDLNIYVTSSFPDGPFPGNPINTVVTFYDTSGNIIYSSTIPFISGK